LTLLKLPQKYFSVAAILSKFAFNRGDFSINWWKQKEGEKSLSGKLLLPG
jgi:hypothetical protein